MPADDLGRQALQQGMGGTCGTDAGSCCSSSDTVSSPTFERVAASAGPANPVSVSVVRLVVGATAEDETALLWIARLALQN